MYPISEQLDIAYSAIKTYNHKVHCDKSNKTFRLRWLLINFLPWVVFPDRLRSFLWGGFDNRAAQSVECGIVLSWLFLEGSEGCRRRKEARPPRGRTGWRRMTKRRLAGRRIFRPLNVSNLIDQSSMTDSVFISNFCLASGHKTHVFHKIEKFKKPEGP